MIKTLFMSNVPSDLALYWDCDPETATHADVVSACGRYKIWYAQPPGYGAFLLGKQENARMLALHRAKLAEWREPIVIPL